jgi:hypothetical protein
MRAWTRGAVVVALAAATIGSGCTGPVRKKQAERSDHLLRAAGFRQIPADNPDRAAALERLPRNQVTPVVRDDRTFYVYPDPTICGCLYVGRADEYDSYRRLLQQEGNPQPEPLPWNSGRLSNGSALLNPGVWGPWDWE